MGGVNKISPANRFLEGELPPKSKFYPQGKNFKEVKKNLRHASHAIFSPFDKKNLFSECGRSPLFQKKNLFEIEDKTFFKRVTPSPEKLKVEEKNICTGGCGKSPHFMEEKF